ncbi:MAG: type IV secretory system conjugative DNA transfer family protein [Candidatus Falkowbacteria bacterium]
MNTDISPNVLSDGVQQGINTYANLNTAYLALFIVAIIVLVVIFRKIFTSISIQNSMNDYAVFLVRLPKEKPKDDGGSKDLSVQQVREDISLAETIFASIGGMRPQHGFMPWLFGRSDNFSFEVVAHAGKISFYVAAPKESALYLEQQINAYYPEASVEEIPDYNAFNPQNSIAAGSLKPVRGFMFPFKTYNDMESDPMNSLINIISKMEPQNSISIQYVVRSAEGGWHSVVKRAVLNAYNNKSVSDIFHSGNNMLSGFASFIIYHIIGGIFGAVEPKDKNSMEKKVNTKELTDKEKEMLKKMEEKNSKAGLDTNIRIVVSATNKIQAKSYLENVVNAFTEYNYYTYGNSFKKGLGSAQQNKLINHFIYRRFIPEKGFILSTEELASMYHFPLPHTETPNIDWLLSKTAPAPTNTPQEGINLGYNLFRGHKTDIRIKRVDRRRHCYIVGKSGTGKSVELLNMAIQDIENGDGVCVMDPNGDLIEDILNRIPPHRAEDVIVFSPGDLERPLAMNLLEYDERYPEQKSFVINEVIGIFDKLYDLKATGGPIFEQYMRNALLLIMDDPESGSTLMEIPKVLADEDFRRMKLSRCKNPTVVDFWRKEAEKAGGEAALANIVPYITSKLTPFVANDMMRPIIGQQKSSFNMRDIMDNKKILMVDLPKGLIGETNAYLLGMIIVGKILMAALSRTDMPAEKRNDFYLYIDEFQNFTTNSICQILSEARKYALCLTVAHQYIGQLSKGQDAQIKDAIFGNVGTLMSFKVGSEDADFLVKDFGPVFNQFDLTNVGRGGFMKLLVDGSTTRPFSFQTIWPLLGNYNEGLSQKIRALSRYKFGQDRRLIEMEIARRAKATVSTDF